MALKIKVVKTEDHPVLKASGRIVNIDSEKFGKKLETFCNGSSEKYVVDLSETDFIDSFGLGMLVRSYNTLNIAKKELVLLNANPNPQGYLKRLFDTTGLNRIFRIVTSMQAV